MEDLVGGAAGTISTMRPMRATRRSRAGVTAALLSLLAGAAACTAVPLLAQDAGSGDASGNGPAADEPELSLLPERPFSTMHMLLERTIFAVDVLTLDVRVDPASAREIEGVLAGAGEVDDERESAVARAALKAEELVGRIEFQRGVSLGQFLDAVGDDMRKAVEAGWLDPAAYREVRDGLPVWFSFLEERGIHEGDRLSYHVRNDTLRTVFATPKGGVLLDQTDVGRQHVVALVGAWFAPDSSFRDQLVESLFERYVESS